MRIKHLLTATIFLTGLPFFLTAMAAVSGNSASKIVSGIPSGPSLPSECDSKTFLRTTGPKAGLYECTSRNTWTLLDAASSAHAASPGMGQGQNDGQLQPLLIARALPVPSPEAALGPSNPAPVAGTSQAGTGACGTNKFVTAVNNSAPAKARK